METGDDRSVIFFPQCDSSEGCERVSRPSVLSTTKAFLHMTHHFSAATHVCHQMLENLTFVHGLAFKLLFNFYKIQ